MTSSKSSSYFRLLTLAGAILFLLILFLFGITQASAAKTDTTDLPVVRVENKTVHRGQTFELNIYLDQNPGLIALMLELEYDKTAMELVGISRGDGLASHTFTTTNTDTEDGFSITPFRMLWDGRTQDTATGVLATLTFESKVDAEIGDYIVCVSYDEQNTNAEYGIPCAVQIQDGCVTLMKGAYTVRYLNYDGSVLYEKDYSENAVPSYGGKTPSRPTDERYAYQFEGWQGAVSDTPDVICYEAKYKRIPQIYQVFFYVDGVYFNAFACAYGEFVDLSQIPSKKNHVFDGWYTDAALTQKVSLLQMTAQDLTLYGTMKFNIRENPIPEITLSIDCLEEEYAYIAVDVTQNPSLSGLVLTLDYDRSALTLVGFEQGEAFDTLQFDYTNTDKGYSADPFRFYWEHTVNTMDLGRLLLLKFKINTEVPAGVYSVTMTYEPTTDAVYINEVGEVSYTKLNIVGAGIPIGEIYYWNEELEDTVDIVVECPQGMPADTILRIELVTSEVEIPKEQIQIQLEPDMEIKSVYTVELLRNKVKVQPDGMLTVRIKLTDAQKLCADLRVYHINDENTMTFYESRVEDGYIIFQTDHLSYWAIVGDVIDTQVNHMGTAMPANYPVIIIAFALLAIACMALCLILMAQKKKWLIAKSHEKGENNT